MYVTIMCICQAFIDIYVLENLKRLCVLRGRLSVRQYFLMGKLSIDLFQEIVLNRESGKFKTEREREKIKAAAIIINIIINCNVLFLSFDLNF